MVCAKTRFLIFSWADGSVSLWPLHADVFKHAVTLSHGGSEIGMNVKRGSEICSEKRKVASGLGCERIAGKNIRKKEASLVRIRCKPQNSEIGDSLMTSVFHGVVAVISRSLFGCGTLANASAMMPNNAMNMLTSKTIS